MVEEYLRPKTIIAILLALALVLPLVGCNTEDTEAEAQRKEEERLQAIHEMGEENRKFHAKRQAFLDSDLYAAGMKYLTGVLEELVPGGEIEITLEPGDYIDATEYELAAIPDTGEGWQEFFSHAELYFMVNYWDFDIDPHELCEALLARQISGSMFADQFYEDEWILDATQGTWDFYRKPGV